MQRRCRRRRRRSHTNTEHGILLLPFEGFRCFSHLLLLLPPSPSSPSWGKTCKMHADRQTDPGPPAARARRPRPRPEEESQYREHVSRDKPQRGQVGLEGGCVTRSGPSPTFWREMNAGPRMRDHPRQKECERRTDGSVPHEVSPIYGLS